MSCTGRDTGQRREAPPQGLRHASVAQAKADASPFLFYQKQTAGGHHHLPGEPDPCAAQLGLAKGDRTLVQMGVTQRLRKPHGAQKVT